MSDYTAKKQRNFSKQYLNAQTADVFFICGNDDNNTESVPAHKFLLFTYSDVFEKMFHGSLPEKNTIRISDASANGFRAFLRYFYFDNHIINTDLIGELIYLAEKYNMSDVAADCWAHLKEVNTPKDILIGYELANAYEIDNMTKMLQLKILKRFNEIFGCEYIRSISRDILKRILQINHIQIHAKIIFDTCMAWAEDACKAANIDPNVLQNCRNQLGDVFDCIEFGAMTRNEIVRMVLTHGELFTSQELRRFIVMIGAKCPTPFNTDQMIKRTVGRAVMKLQKIRLDKMTELHFNVQSRVILGGIEIDTIYEKRFEIYGFRLSGIISIVKVSPNRQQYNDIVLLKGTFSFPPLDSSVDVNKVLFPEPIIIEPHFKYAIQFTLMDNGKFTDKIYHKRTTYLSDLCLFRIFPETNCKMISGLLYNLL